MSLFNPKKLISYTQDAKRCYFGSAPTLAIIDQAYGPRTAYQWVMTQLIGISEFSGSKGKITKYQLSQLSEMIISRVFYLKVSELMLFFRRIQDGKYGSFYGSFDPIMVTNALGKFLVDRGQAYYNHEHGYDEEYDYYFKTIDHEQTESV
jgi:hypothetical protein